MNPHESQGEERRFLHHCLTQIGVLESICCRCGERVACSPDLKMVKAAEAGHLCATQGKAASAKGGTIK